MSDVTEPTPPPIEHPVPVQAVTVPDAHDTVVVERRAAPVVPSGPRDGTIKGEPVYSDGHCPLLVDEADIDNRSVIEDHGDGSQTVHRYAQILLTDPTPCPTCGKVVEKHQLVHQASGDRDCAIAIAARANPKYGRLYAADASGDDDAVVAEAAKHGSFGDRFLKVFRGLIHSGTHLEPTPEPVEERELSPEARAHEKWLADGKPPVTAEEWEARVHAERSPAEKPVNVGAGQREQTGMGQYSIGADGAVLRDGAPVPQDELDAYAKAFAEREAAQATEPQPPAAGE